MSNGDETDLDLLAEETPAAQDPGLVDTLKNVGSAVIRNSPASMLTRGNAQLLGLEHVDPLDPSTFTLDPPVEGMVDPLAGAEPGQPHPGTAMLAKIPTKGSDPTLFDDGKKGKGRGGPEGSIEFGVGPPVPGHIQAEQLGFAGMQADLESIRQMARAQAAGLAFDNEQNFGEAYREHQALINDQVNALITEAEDEKNAIGELIDAAKSNRINPGQFFANIGDAGKFAAAIAVGAGAMASTFAGGPNVAFQVIKNAVDRSVRAQIYNQTHDRALIAHQTNFVNTIRGLSKDRAAYGNYVSMGLTAMAQSELSKINFSLIEADAQIAARMVYAKMGAWLVDQKIKSLAHSQARVTWKYKSMGQYYQGLQIAAGAGQAAKAPGKAPSQAVPRARGGAGKAQAQQVTDSVQLAMDALSQGGSPQQVVDRYTAGLHARPDGPREDDPRILRELARSVAEQTGDPTDIAYAHEIARRPDQDFARKRTVPVAYGQNKLAQLKVIDEESWKKQENKAAVSSALSQINDFIELDQLMGRTNIPPDAALLKDFGIFDDKISMSQHFSGTEAQQRAKVKALTTTITSRYFRQLNDKQRNAMNVRWEREFAQSGAGTNVTFLEWLGDMLRRDPDVRKARLSPAADKAIESARQTIINAGLWYSGL